MNISTDIKSDGWPDYGEEIKAELDKRNKAYKNGTEKIVSASESKERIKEILDASIRDGKRNYPSLSN